MLLLLRELTLVKVWTLGLVSYHCNTVYDHFYHLLPCCFYYFRLQKPNLLSILHLYHHLFARLVHLYNLPLYWVCWGHKRLFVIWLQGCLRETIFILRLPRIDKPGHPLEGNLLLSYKPLHLEAQQRLQGEGCVVDIKLFYGAIAGEMSASRYILRSCNQNFLFLVLSLV